MNKRETAGKTIFTIFLAWTFILLVWFTSYCISNRAYTLQKDFGDLSTVLFGSASIALFILSLFVGFLAIFGWQTLQNSVKSQVETVTKREIETVKRDTEERIKYLENELEGRVYSILGFVIGEISFDSGTFEANDKDRLSDAIENSRRARNLLKGTGRPSEYLALNNLVFYSSLVGDKSMRGHVMADARLLKDAGQEHHNRNLLLTYCRAVIEFGTDRAEIEDAQTISQAIAENPRSSEREKREARAYMLAISGILNKAEERL